MTFTEYLTGAQETVDRSLAGILSSVAAPRKLAAAMEYSLLGGGKRLRPAMLLFACQMFPGTTFPIKAACAIEMIHAYSLIHDDLPAMDDDDFRRGKPSLHRRFDEGTAILAGDALLTLAFHTLAEEDVSASSKCALITELASASGASGMIAGQVLDMSASPSSSIPDVILIHELKTSRLFSAALRMGAIASGADAEGTLALTSYAVHFGRLYQAADDLEDYLCQTSDADRATYPGVAGELPTREHIFREAIQARAAIACFQHRAWWLDDLVDSIVKKVSVV